MNHTLAKLADDKEAAAGHLLLRGEVVGPPRRWATWIAIAATSCIVAFLLNESRVHSPLLIRLLPTSLSEIVSLMIGLVLLTPYTLDLALATRARRWPWSRTPHSPRMLREHPDIVGTISRLSPPLLFAVILAIAMAAATYIVGVHEPEKLLPGFGIVGVFVAGLLAAPALLQTQAPRSP